MIYLRLAGGLGNQLYQLAAAKNFATLKNDRISLVHDGLSRYASARNSESVRLFSTDFLSDFEDMPKNHLWSTIIDRSRIGRWLPVFGVDDIGFARLSSGSRGVPKGPVFMDGYFQSGWRLDGLMATAMRMRGSLVQPLHLSEESSSTLLLHIRGGDFLKVPLHQVVDLQYYEHAVMEMYKTGKTFDRCLCVTDDVEHASRVIFALKEKVSLPEVVIRTPAQDPLDDFRLIGRHPWRIIGNSTFSWWGALLGRHDGLLISPKQFTRARDRDLCLPFEILLDQRSGWRTMHP
jgi:Glycosyl transferase family 11